MLVGNAGLVFAPRLEEPVPIASQVEEAIARTQSVFQPLPARLPRLARTPGQQPIERRLLSPLRYPFHRVSPETQSRP